MKQRILVAATALLVVGAIGAGTGVAAPTPVYTVTCGSTGFSQATWQKAKLSEVRFEWVATSGSFDPTTVPVTPTPPKGFVVTSPTGPGNGPTSLTVTFTRADGSGADAITVPCA